jgi:hypothetical protein
MSIAARNGKVESGIGHTQRRLHGPASTIEAAHMARAWVRCIERASASRTMRLAPYVPLVDDSLDAVGLALREKVTKIIEGLDGSELSCWRKRTRPPACDRGTDSRRC